MASESIYEIPKLTTKEERLIERLRGLYLELARMLVEPRVWRGSLAKAHLALSIQASNSIEGYDADMAAVMAAVDNETDTGEPGDETKLATSGYRDAMTYVLQLGEDKQRQVTEETIQALHFMVLRHNLEKNPGRYRPGPITVVREDTAEVVYMAPDAHRLQELMRLLIEQLGDRDGNPLVIAAMAHLNLTMIHPFSDGNGRMARCLQTLLLAKSGVLSPTFSSIEEEIGRQRERYYAVLADVGEGSWNPQKSALPFVSFCLQAHLRQAANLKIRTKAISALFRRLHEVLQTKRLPQRAIAPCIEVAFGRTIRRQDYIKIVERGAGEEISEMVASRDLSRLVKADLFTPQGERRSRVYLRSNALLKHVAEVSKEAHQESVGLFMG